MKRLIIITDDTAGLTTDQFHVNENSSATIAARGLAGSEAIALHMRVNDDWIALFQEGAAVSLTATNNILYAVPPGVYRLVKTATAAATSVEIYNLGG